MKTEGFKTIINGKEIKGNPVTVKWQKIENKDEPKPKVLIETTSEEVPGKTSKAYTKFVKGTAGDLKKTKQTRDSAPQEEEVYEPEEHVEEETSKESKDSR